MKVRDLMKVYWHGRSDAQVRISVYEESSGQRVAYSLDKHQAAHIAEPDGPFPGVAAAKVETFEVFDEGGPVLRINASVK